MLDNKKQKDLPIFPLRNSVLFPYALGPFSAGRRITIAAIDASVESEEKELAVFTPERHQSRSSQ